LLFHTKSLLGSQQLHFLLLIFGLQINIFVRGHKYWKIIPTPTGGALADVGEKYEEGERRGNVKERGKCGQN
jgi:hypothetical protein